jgi:type I restriction enzyme, S subunit
MFGDPVVNPMGWDVSRLSEVCIKITDGTHHSPVPQENGFPYVTAKHVKEYGLDFERRPTYVDENAHIEIYKRCSPELGDVLYIKDGATTGIACINTFKEQISLLSSLALIKPKPEILGSYYLSYWLNHNGMKAKLIREYMSGAAIQRFTLKKIKTFQITTPPIALQVEFSNTVRSIDNQKALVQEGLRKSENLFQSLLQKAFKGELMTDNLL